MPTTRTLRVYANPYAAIDHEGRPSGAFPHEPDLVNGDVTLRYVGAERKVTELSPAVPRLGIEAQHDRAWTFSADPVDVPNTDYYRRAIKSGELIAADADAWKAAGLPVKDFVDGTAVLAKAKEAAIANHVAHYGEEPAATVAHGTKAAEPAPKSSEFTPAQPVLAASRAPKAKE